MITRQRAWEIITTHLANKNLIRHCLAVEASMRALAKKRTSEVIEKWGIVGLLHDGDWEKTQHDPKLHTTKMIEWLQEAGETDQEIFQAMRSHNFVHTGFNPPTNLMEWSLYCCDELTGLIVAATLVLPDKKLSSLSVESVLKRFREKKFAAGAHREQISACEEKLGIKLEDFIAIVLKAMQGIAEEIGL